MTALNLGELAGNRSVSSQAQGSASHPQTPVLQPRLSLRSVLTSSLPGTTRPTRAQTARAAAPPPLSIRGRTFSCVADDPLHTPVAGEPLAGLAPQASASLAEELLAESTPRTARHARSISQTISLTLTHRRHPSPRTPGPASSSSSPAPGGDNDKPKEPLSVGAAAAQTPEQQQHEKEEMEKRQQEALQALQGVEKIFGGTVDEQVAAAQAVQASRGGAEECPEEGEWDVPPFLRSLVAKLRALGPKEDARALRAMWEAGAERDAPREVQALRAELQGGRVRLADVPVDARLVALLLAEYLRALAAPLVSARAQRLLLPPAQAGYDDVELAAALLPALWTLTRCEYAALRALVLALRELYVVPAQRAPVASCSSSSYFSSSPSSTTTSSASSSPSAVAAQTVAAVLAGPLFQCGARDERQRAPFVRVAACLLESGDELFAPAPQLAYGPEGDGRPALVACATPPLLVETLTNEFYTAEDFSYLFLLTYQYYMTHEEAYSILVTHFQRWASPDASSDGGKGNGMGASASAHSNPNIGAASSTPSTTSPMSPWRERKRAMIQNVICRWVRVRGSELVVDAEGVVALLQAQFGAAPATDTQSVAAYLDACRAHVPTAVYIPAHGSDASARRVLSALRQDPRALAQQLALFHQRLFCAVPLAELLGKKKPSPDVADSDIFASTLTRAFDRLVHWLAAALLAAPADARPDLLVAVVRLAKALRRLHDYHGAQAVSNALQHSTVARLRDAWERLPRKRLADVDALAELFRPPFVNYRAAVDGTRPPAVPCFTVIRKDIAGFEEVLPTWLPARGAPNAMVNVDKLRKVARVLQQVRLYQLTPYPFQPIPALQEDLTVLPFFDDNALFSLAPSSRSSSS